MYQQALLSSFPFDNPDAPVSLYEYAPVLRVRDRRGDWVLKRTGLVHSSGTAIGNWLVGLRRLGIDVVAPAAHLAPNPRQLADGKEWVVYPFIQGTGYHASSDQIGDSGRLLGKMHAANLAEAYSLKTYDSPVFRTPEWVEKHLASARAAMRDHGVNLSSFEARVGGHMSQAVVVEGLPLSGCSLDFKASNLIFGPKPTLIDPDHAARMPRLYDLAVALLFFHCDLPTAPGRVWDDAEWRIFLNGYREEVSFTPDEVENWGLVLTLAWLDQAVWLLGNWPEGWADSKERRYLVDLATLDLGRFSLMSVV
jgi:spectinomycin phosphotransferase